MRLFRTRLAQKLFFIHIMKTGGTSFRKMLTRAISRSKDLYPNDQDLETLPNHWYPSARQVVQDKCDHKLRDFDVLCGHYPMMLGEHVFDEPYWTVAILRDPVRRTLSMLAHRRKHSAEFADRDPQAMLDDEEFVAKQVRNYQTKMFAFDNFDECVATVNCPLSISPERFQLACQRLRRLDVVGLTEQFEESVDCIGRLTGMKFSKVIRTNVTKNRRRITAGEDELEKRIIELVPYDIELYELAKQLFERQMTG